MSNRWLRFGYACIAIGLVLAAGYRIFQQEQRLTSSIQSARVVDRTAEAGLVTTQELKAALHAYVAEGQGQVFWTARAATLSDRLRAALLELDGPVAAIGTSLDTPLQLLDRVVALERRARDFLRAGQQRLAGETIFNDLRDSLDKLSTEIAAVRSQLGSASADAQADMRREQAALAGAAGAIMAAGLLWLSWPRGDSDQKPIVAINPDTVVKDVAESSARLVSRTPITSTGVARTGGSVADTSTAASVATEPAVATTSPEPATTLSLKEAATICTELGRASQSVEVSTLLARAAALLDASGAILWMATPDGRDLTPVASAGYDEALLERIGSIPRTSHNLTAGAIRTGAPRTTPRSDQGAAALAVPLLTPLGAVGVLSAEIKQVGEVDEGRLAVSMIFAAQLAGLVGARSHAAGQAGGSAQQASG